MFAILGETALNSRHNFAYSYDNSVCLSDYLSVEAVHCAKMVQDWAIMCIEVESGVKI